MPPSAVPLALAAAVSSVTPLLCTAALLQLGSIEASVSVRAVAEGEPLTPLERYEHDLGHQHLLPDVAQRELVSALDHIHHALVADATAAATDSWLKSVRTWIGRGSEPPVTGLYAFGGVGRGKTYMMNLFYEQLPFKRKMRVHFHHFMQRIQNELKQLKQQADPLEVVSDRLIEQAQVICFDEFYVTDIADAMLLGRLLKHLFTRRMTLITTSNTAPNDLYLGGLQRERFLPTIALLQQHLQVFHIRSTIDYRLRILEQAETYHCPLDAAAEQRMHDCYQQLAKADLPRVSSVVIEGRRIAVRRIAEDVAWFEFIVLCSAPRSVSDYIEIARRYHSVLVSHIPLLDDHHRDQVLRFVHLVDELYDRGVNLIVSADAAANRLYNGKYFAHLFERTSSRLCEMQTHDYLTRKHRVQ